jgi:serine/threonine protein kinase
MRAVPAVKTAPPPPPPVIATCVKCGTKGDQAHCSHCGTLVKAGHYIVTTLVRETDHGGTYLVREPGSLEVVLQELRPPEAPSHRVMQNWEREAELLLAFKHPRVPKFLDIFHEGKGADTRFYRVQQRVIGDSIADQVVRFPFEESRLRDISRQVLELLDLLHGPTYRLVHGDIKPASLILDNDGMLWVVGWGASVLLPDPKDRPPEAAPLPDPPPGRANHPSADVYAVGATLVWMLARKDPSSFLKPGVKPNLEQHLQASPQMLGLLTRLVGEPAYSRIDSAAETLRQLKSVHLKRKRRGPPLWAIALITFGLLGSSALYIYFHTNW